MSIPLPQRPAGTLQEQVARQYAYLFELAQQLNLALQQTDTVLQQTVHSTDAEKKEQTQQYQTLKSMIIKTATQVQQEMDTLSVQLKGNYVAVSQFGTYVEQLNSYIEANPAALTQYYSFASDLRTDTDAVSAAFADYKASTEGYIRTGIVYYDGAVPVYGVAVGQNLSVTEVDGQQVVAQNNFRATYTASKLSFWQDAEEVAYVSNNRLYITNITVLSSLTVGREWKISTGGGLKFQWIGG